MWIVNYLTQFCRHFQLQFKNEPPAVLHYYSTKQCNMRCRHCNEELSDSKGDLTFDEIKELSNNAGYIESIGMGGGEPFLRPDLVEICELFTTNNGVKLLTLHTNGFATDKIYPTVREVLEKLPRTVNLHVGISLDGFASTHDYIRREGAFEKAMQTAKQLTELRDEFSNFTLYFNATLNDLNYKELPALAKFCRQEFQARLECSVLVGKGRDESISLPETQIVDDIIEQIYSEHDSSRLSTIFRAVLKDVIYRTGLKKRQVVPCQAGIMWGTLCATGEVYICNKFPPIGNLRDNTYKEIWSGDEAKRQRRVIKKGKCACVDSCCTAISLQPYWKLPFMVIRQGIKQYIQ